MGVWTAARKLGLGLAALEKSSVRRCSSLAGNTKSGEVNIEKSIYLCFHEWISKDYSNQVVCPVKLNTGDGDGTESMLAEAAYKRFRHWHSHDSISVGTCGSRIIFSCGLESFDTCWLDTSTPPPLKFQDSSSRKIKRSNSIKTTKSNSINTRPLLYDVDVQLGDVQLGEVDGKLYRINNHIQRIAFDLDSSTFDVFDLKKEAWLPLPTPPFIQIQDSDTYCASFLDSAKKIIGWDCPRDEEPEPEVFCFDITNPENGWTCLGNNDLYSCSKEYGTFIVHNHHPRLGDYHVIFGYEPGTLQVTGLFLSHDFLTFQFPYIETHLHLQLPPSCSEFTTTIEGHEGDDDDECDYDIPSEHIAEYKFVHLGGQKVAIVLYKYVGQEGCVLLIAEFEYELTNCGPTVEVQSRLISTRRFRYLARQMSEPVPDAVRLLLGDPVTLNGAFLL